MLDYLVQLTKNATKISKQSPAIACGPVPSPTVTCLVPDHLEHSAVFVEIFPTFRPSVDAD